MATVVVQMGHVARTTGATGTRREQEFAKKIGVRIVDRLRAKGHTAHLVGADDPIPSADVFVALHTDGSTNPSIRGASVGYPNDVSGRLAAAWKKHHQRAGYNGGFLPDNYTDNLHYYYGFRKSNAKYEYLAEHGHTTNPTDEAWLFGNVDACAQAHVDAIGEIVGHPVVTKPGDPVVPLYKNIPAAGSVQVGDAFTKDGNGMWMLWEDGSVWCYGNAPYCGGVNGKAYFSGRKAARIVRRDGAAGTTADPAYEIIATTGEKYGSGGF